MVLRSCTEELRNENTELRRHLLGDTMQESRSRQGAIACNHNQASSPDAQHGSDIGDSRHAYYHGTDPSHIDDNDDSRVPIDATFDDHTSAPNAHEDGAALANSRQTGVDATFYSTPGNRSRGTGSTSASRHNIDTTAFYPHCDDTAVTSRGSPYEPRYGALLARESACACSGLYCGLRNPSLCPATLSLDTCSEYATFPPEPLAKAACMPYRFGDPGALTADDLVMAAEDVTDLDGTLTATPHPVIDPVDDYREQIRVLQAKLTASEARVAASATHTHRLSAALLDSQEKLAQSQNDLATSQQRVEATPHHSQLLPARPSLISVTTVDADALREHLAETTTALVRVRAEKQALELHCDTLQQDGADLQHASRQLREAATACKSQMSAKRRENRELQKQVSKLSRSRNKLRDSLRSVQGEQSALVGQLQSAAARVRDDTRIAEHRSVHFQVGNSRMAAANGGPTHGYDAAAVGASSSHVEVLDPGLGGMVAGTGSTDLRTMADSLSQLQLRMETLRDSSSCASSVSGWSSADDTGAEAWGTQPLQRTRGYTPHTKRSGRKPASVDEALAARRMAKDLRRQSNKLG